MNEYVCARARTRVSGRFVRQKRPYYYGQLFSLEMTCRFERWRQRALLSWRGGVGRADIREYCRREVERKRKTVGSARLEKLGYVTYV